MVGPAVARKRFIKNAAAARLSSIWFAARPVKKKYLTGLFLSCMIAECDVGRWDRTVWKKSWNTAYCMIFTESF